MSFKKRDPKNQKKRDVRSREVQRTQTRGKRDQLRSKSRNDLRRGPRLKRTGEKKLDGGGKKR